MWMSIVKPEITGKRSEKYKKQQPIYNKKNDKIKI